MSPLGDGMSIESSSPGGVRPPGAAPHPTRLQALTLWPEEDPVAGLVAVRLSIVLRRAEREACHWGRGAGERPVPRTHPPYWAPLPLCSSPEITCTPARPQGCSCQPCPALLQKQGLPNWRGTAQLTHGTLASPTHTAWGSQDRDTLTSAWPPGVSVLLQRSQRRQGRCQSFPSEVTFSARAGTRREGHTSRPARMPRGSTPHGDVTSAYKIPRQPCAPQPPASLPPLCCLTGDRRWPRTAIKPTPPTWEVTAADKMHMKPCTQELLQEDPSLQVPWAHPSVPPTPSLSQNPLPAPLRAPGVLCAAPALWCRATPGHAPPARLPTYQSRLSCRSVGTCWAPR